MAKPRILVCLANGIEEMEAVTCIDLFIRAEFDVITASANKDGSLEILGSRGIRLFADQKLVDVVDDEFDCIVLPGGVEGATTLGESALVVAMLNQQICDRKWVAAICAAPALVIEKNKLHPLAHKTCHPAFIEQIAAEKQINRRVYSDPDHLLITSQGPGTALEFSVEIIFQLAGKKVAKTVTDPLVCIPTLHYEKKFSDIDA